MVDEVGGVLRDVGIGGEHRRDRLADIAHAVGREHRLAIRLQPLDAAFAEIDRRHVGDVGGGPHRDDARQRPRRRGVDGDDPAMGDLRADDPHVKLMRKRDVAGKAPAPGDQRRVFEPRHRLADIFVGLRGHDGGDFHGCASVDSERCHPARASLSSGTVDLRRESDRAKRVRGADFAESA